MEIFMLLRIKRQIDHVHQLFSNQNKEEHNDIIGIIENSLFFDEEWYTKQYAHLNLMDTQPAFHFLQFATTKHLDDN